MSITTIESANDFWSIIDTAAERLVDLERALLALDQPGLVSFHGLYTILSWDAVYEDELFYEEGGYMVSEDGIEDFGWWIVTQGKTYFDSVTTEAIPLQTALRTHFSRPDAPKAVRAWKSGGDREFDATNFLQLAQDVHERRFNTPLEPDLDRAYAIRDR